MSELQPAGVTRDVPLHLVDDPAIASRSEMDDAKMDELVSSIRAHGLIHNVTLEQLGERYRVVAGHRRTVAARRAGLPFIPAKVYPEGHPSLRVIQAHENSRREDVNPVDEAIWFAELLEAECGGDIEKLCGLVGERLSYVDNRLQLLQLDEATREALRAGKIKIGVATELQKVTDPQYRAYYLAHAVRDGATVATVTGWVQQWRATFGAESPTPPASAAPLEPAIVEHVDPHRCFICGKSDARYIPEQISVHTHCRIAILEPMLERAANGEGTDVAASDPRRI